MKKLLVLMLCVCCFGCGKKESEEKTNVRLSLKPDEKVVVAGHQLWSKSSAAYICNSSPVKSISGNELYSIYKYWEENRPLYEKIIAEYKATHTKCDYCEKEFLTKDLHKFNVTYVDYWDATMKKVKYICPKCKSDFKYEYVNMISTPEDELSTTTDGAITDTVDTIAWEYLPETIHLSAEHYTKKVKVKKVGNEIIITLDKREKP